MTADALAGLRYEVEQAMAQAGCIHDVTGPAGQIIARVLSFAAEQCSANAATPPSNDDRHPDWQAGWQDGAMHDSALLDELATAARGAT